jgi:hypothetical protein
VPSLCEAFVIDPNHSKSLQSGHPTIFLTILLSESPTDEIEREIVTLLGSAIHSVIFPFIGTNLVLREV